VKELELTLKKYKSFKGPYSLAPPNKYTILFV
jgi:hypothetical protein